MMSQGVVYERLNISMETNTSNVIKQPKEIHFLCKLKISNLLTER